MTHIKKIRKAVLLALLLATNLTIYAVEYSVFTDCGERCERMTKELIKFARNGSPQAQTILAVAYRTGNLVKQDDKKAWRWMKRAKKQGYLPALYKISGWYRSGYNIEVNISKANTYLEESAKSNYPPALLALGKLYYSNNNIEEAKQLIKKSASYGNLDAKRLIKKIIPQITEDELFGGKRFSENTMVIIASEQDPFDMLDTLLQRIKDLGFYNWKGTTGSRINGMKCGKLASPCKTFTRRDLDLSGVSQFIDLLKI